MAEWWRYSRVAYLTGPAGRGKTSLLQAGVLPLPPADKRHVLPVGRLSYGAAFPAAGFPDHNPYSSAAVAVLNDVLRRDGANLTALRARGEILAYLGEAREAIRDLERVSPQGQPSISAARGLALARLGDKVAARRAVEDALDKGPRNGPVLLYAARMFALIGDDISAREFAEQAATATDPPLSPPHRAAARQLAGRW